MDNLKIGDFVYFSLGNEDTEKLFKYSGMVINISDNEVSILNIGYCTNTIYNVTLDNIRPITDREDIINEINEYYNKQIDKLQSQIKSVKRECYKEDIVKEYCTLKQEIINTAKHMIEAKDDEDFENKLKAICSRKKEIFAIECEELHYARKDNGVIKYKMRELKISRDSDIKNLNASLEDLKKRLNIK